MIIYILCEQQTYQGEIDPITKLRHGHGIYTYPNKFFQYKGEWQQGKKHGKGTLLMPTQKYEGDFQDGQITGSGKLFYSFGSQYEGQFLNGEKHGKGIFLGYDGERYEGEWKFNVYDGNGELLRINGDIIKGQFKNNYPEGEVQVYYGDGKQIYKGSMVKGLRHGKGLLIDQNNKIEYEGNFEFDLKCGEGILKSTNSNYIFEGQFLNDIPIILPNKFMISTVFLEDSQHSLTDSQKNLKGKKEQQQKNEDEENILNYSLRGKPLNLEIRTIYQGPPEVDSIQLTQEEIQQKQMQWQKENKKKNINEMPDFTIPQMKIPNAEIIIQESGRKIRLCLAQEIEQVSEENQNLNQSQLLNQSQIDKKYKRFRVDYREFIQKRKKEIKDLMEEREREKFEEEHAKDQPAKKQAKKQPQKKKDAVEDVDESERILYFKQEGLAEEDIKQDLLQETKQGLIQLSELEFPDDFPVGTFYLLIFDETQVYDKIPNLKIQLNILPEGGLSDKKGVIKGQQRKK